MTEIIGYLDHWSVRAGDTITAFVHSDPSREVTADIVELTRFSGHYATGPAVAGTPSARVTAAPQHTAIGSFARAPIPALAGPAGCTLSLLVRPTFAHAGTIVAIAGDGGARAALQWNGVDEVRLLDADGVTRCVAPLVLARWSSVVLVVQRDGCTLTTSAHRRRTATAHTARTPWVPQLDAATTLWLAAAPDVHGRAAGHFDGLVDAPAVHRTALSAGEAQALHATPGAHAAAHPALVAAWDASRECASDRLVDVGPLALHGTLFQGPTRLVPGAFWTAGVLDPARDPAGFAAVHFHQDDLRDAGWGPTVRLTLPATLASGVYGLRVRCRTSDDLDVIPFWVRAPSAAAARALAYLAPTYTYLAYGNAPNAMLGPPYWGADHPSEHQRKAHREFGPSLYSRHPDHSGVSLVSRHRPILTIRPGVRPWGFESDRLLTDWLQRHAYDFDVLTDEDVDAEGLAALAAHRVIVTGNHPEYWSARMLDALEEWLQQGGRLLYTGGNGFYWKISSLASLPGVIECRRAEGGTRPWIAEPGCTHHQLDGAPGGLWRRLGRPPQGVVGVGFAGQGFERSAPYRVRPEARAGWTAFALQGVEGEQIGTSGRFGGGAAGQEIDRHDLRLGSPRESVVLASSQGLHDAVTLRTLEELLSHEPYAPDPKVRADVTLVPVDGGGMVFTTGSMAWVGALDDAGVSQVMRNVLDRFLDPAALVAGVGAADG
ncbi:MAG: hypothetical protein IT355_13945 [Gemmatimonadaceae bacterium]|nr:hypothetical protein [Gemmatimonadaceae bacterium]